MKELTRKKSKESMVELLNNSNFIGRPVDFASGILDALRESNPDIDMVSIFMDAMSEGNGGE